MSNDLDKVSILILYTCMYQTKNKIGFFKIDLFKKRNTTDITSYMASKYHKDANVASGCKASPNVDSFNEVQKRLGKPAQFLVEFRFT